MDIAIGENLRIHDLDGMKIYLTIKRVPMIGSVRIAQESARTTGFKANKSYGVRVITLKGNLLK